MEEIPKKYNEYKVSKFNYWMHGARGNTIFYNHLFSQLCSFPKQYSQQIDEIMNTVSAGSISMIENNGVFEELLKRNLILPSEYDEEAVSKLNYMDEITINALCFIIYPTMACNFRCPYCYQEHENINMSESIADGIISFVRKNITKFRELHIAWFGGEPLLRMDFIQKMSEKFIDICHKRSRLYTSAITTNGYLLNKERFLQLYSLNVRKFAVTIDGLKDIHDKQRFTIDGNGSFDKIIENLLEIKTISPNLKFELNIRSNVSCEALDNLEEYVKYMSDLFADDSRFCFSFRPVYDWGGNSIDSFRDHLLDSYTGAKRLYDRLYEMDYPMNYYQHYEEITNCSICYASREYTYSVETDGRLSKCTSAHRDAPYYYIGSIDESGRMKLDRNLVAQWSTPYRNISKCQDCFFEANCHSNFCVLDKVINNSDKIKCPGGKMYLEEYIKLLDKNNDKYRYIEEVAIGKDT